MQARGTPSCGACAVRRPRVRWPLMWQGLPNKPEGRERLDPVTEEPTVTYETQTVKCLRGLESRTVKKWEDAGWEIVSHKQGALQSEIQIRRPKPKTPWKLYAIVGGVVGVLLVTLIVNGIIRERSAQPATAPAASASQGQVQPSIEGSDATDDETTEAEPSTTPSTESAITTSNNSEFKALLRVGDQCDQSVAAFAKKYEGRTISFDASIGAMAPHESFKTRYDILLSAGDYSETDSVGPYFQFRDVAPTSDLNYTGDVPDTIGVGTNLHVVATVVEFEKKSCLFLLEPVETSFR